MFEQLGQRLQGVFSQLRKRGVLSEDDVRRTLREIRIALLEADVALPVVKDCVARLQDMLVGEKVLQHVSPAQMVAKLVQDALTDLLGGELTPFALQATPPVVIMMVGLQGSGKTTTTGKLAAHIQKKLRKKPLVASLDVYRPAAQQQLARVAQQIGADALPIVEGQSPQEITKRALHEATHGGYDTLLLDTAGRLHIDDALMAELQEVKALATPHHVLFVADALTGQDAVRSAQAFNDAVGVTGAVLTRMDGDSRGGAALSIRHVTGCPLLFAGVGEKLDALEPFHPERVASRILGMGDVVSLVEKAAETVDQKEAEETAARMMQGQFDFNDLLKQFGQMRKMGGMGGIMKMLPGMGALQDKLKDKQPSESVMRQSEAIILSMTREERANPRLLGGARKRRIAAGSGTTIQQVNRLMKQLQQMQTMMKKMRKMGKKGLMRGGLQQLLQG